MSANNPGTSRSRPPSLKVLPHVPVSELKEIRVTLRTGNVTASSSSRGSIERDIEDPKQITAIVHARKSKDDPRKSKLIFDRDDIVVNQEERLEAHKPRSCSRCRLRSPKRDRSGSSSYRRRSRSSSCSRSRSRSLNVEKNRLKVVNIERRKSLDRESDRGKDKRNLDRRGSFDRDNGRNLDKEKGRSVDRSRRLYKDKPRSRERDEDRYRRKSRTPLRPGEYRPSHADLRRRSRSREREIPHDKYRPTSRRSRSLSRERHKPSHKSPSPDYRKPSTSRKPSRSPRRSITPTRAHDRPRSPKYGETSKSQRSTSHVKSEKPYYVEKRGRERSPGYKSPIDKNRRSRSPSRDRNRLRSPNKYPESSKARPRSSTLLVHPVDTTSIQEDSLLLRVNMTEVQRVREAGQVGPLIHQSSLSVEVVQTTGVQAGHLVMTEIGVITGQINAEGAGVGRLENTGVGRRMDIVNPSTPSTREFLEANIGCRVQSGLVSQGEFTGFTHQHSTPEYRRLLFFSRRECQW